MHVAGSIHADVTAPKPQWLTPSSDLNALDRAIWSSSTSRNDSGEVTIADCAVTEIIHQEGSPIYIIDEADFRQRARRFADAFSGWSVYYAGKAFLSKTIARWVAEEGLCLDVCSGGELAIATAAHFPPARIGMHGNNKSTEELKAALEAGVGRIIVDSLDEITRLEHLCEQRSLHATVMVRVTAGVEAHTHEYIATAHEDQKFGFSIANGQAMVAMVRCHFSPWLSLAGIHSHIGSQIFDTAGFEVAAKRTMKLMRQFTDATGATLPELDLGGGFGIAYTSDDSPASIETLAKNLREIVEHEARAFDIDMPHCSIEPGRAIVGPSGTALYTVGTIKTVDLEGGAQRVYISVDGGMSDNIRPALYAAEYTAAVANRSSQAEPILSRVVGKHCEGGDILVRDVFLPADIEVGDIIAVPASGAYSRSMASNYNHALRPAVVSVRDGQISGIIRRETMDDLLSLDIGK